MSRCRLRFFFAPIWRSRIDDELLAGRQDGVGYDVLDDEGFEQSPPTTAVRFVPLDKIAFNFCAMRPFLCFKWIENDRLLTHDEEHHFDNFGYKTSSGRGECEGELNSS